MARGHFFEIADRLSALPGDVFEHRLEHSRILGVLGIVPKQQIGEEPFAEQGAFFADHFIQRHADLVGEPHVQMMALNGNALRFEECGERPELDRRVLRKAKRHVDERHLRLDITHATPIQAGWNSRSALAAR